jgi:AraC-like DNA-binding protein
MYFDELGSSPCVLALAAICQQAVGDTFTTSPLAVLFSLADRFDGLPPPASFLEAAAAMTILVKFAVQLGCLVHARLHPGVGEAPCTFEPTRYVPFFAFEPARPGALSPVTALREWTERFTGDLAKAHNLIVERARAAMLQDCARPASMAQLARDSGVSASVLRRRFTAAVGVAPARYRTRQRVVAALPEIWKGEKMEAAAAAAGWKTRKPLYSALRATTGFSVPEVRAMSETERNALLLRLLNPQKADSRK